MLADKSRKSTRLPQQLGVLLAGLVIGTAAIAAPERELTILAADTVTPAALSEETAQRLHELYELGMKNPTHFSYPWVDPASGEVVIDITSERGDQLARALSNGGRSAKVPQRIRTVQRSWAQFEQIRDDIVSATTSKLGPELDTIVEMEPDGPNNRLVITVDSLSKDLLAALAALYGTEAIAIRYDPQHQRPMPLARENDSSSGGFYAGANLSGCTSGFSWYWGTTNAMVTAAHCFPGSGGASTPVEYMGWVNGASRENWNNGTGTVFLTGESTNRGDIALVELASPKQSAGRIYRGGYNSGTSAPVKEMWNRQAATGDQYCSGGRMTGEQCGWSVSTVRFDIKYSTGEWARNVNRGGKQGQCLIGGDSGGPIYTVRSDGGIAAKGIISAGSGGGSDNWGGAFDPCVGIFTDIWQAYWGFPGVLRTQ